METQDFKVGWKVKIVGHRNPDYDGLEGYVEVVARHIIVVGVPKDEDSYDVFNCMSHELIVLDKG